MIFVYSLTVLSVEVVSGSILSDTRHIMGHSMELRKVKVTFGCNLVHWAELLEYNLSPIDPV